MFPELELREGWITVVCLLLMVLCVAWSIQAADWADGLSILQGTVLVGGALGIVLAKSRVPNRLAHLLSLLAGWTWSLYLTSQVLARAINVPGPMAVIELEERFYDLFLIPFNEGMTADNHVFILLLGFLLWVVAYFCAWSIFRWQRVWWSVIVCGVAILLNMSYAAEDLTVYLILFLLFALLLVVRASLAYYEQEWRAAHVGYSPELISVFLRAGLVFSVVVILLAWAAPAALASRPLQPFWDKIGEPWRQFQERSARVFQDLNYRNEPPLVSLGDRRMWFGGPVNLSDTPIADVDASTGRYWRVVVFHEYIGDGWLSNDPDIILIGSDEQDLAFPEFDLRFEMTQTVTLLRDWQTTDSLIAAGQPLRAGLALRAAVTFVTQEEDLVRAPDSSQFPRAPGDPSALYSRRPLQVGESYEVLSSLTEADAESLRQAGTSYPDWIRPRYLQLPESLPQRVRLLAAAITEGLETPYDKAMAIETYLRGIPYDEEIEGPRLGQDGVDYFLFDAETGYCEYYASAMVVMLRSVGVPARYVRGYSQGETEEGVFRLRESDGHAWPEVFFPGYGWVEFEPTGGEPPLLRSESLESEDTTAAMPDRPAGLRDHLPMPDEGGGLDALGLEEEQGPAPWWQEVGLLGWSAVGVAALGLVGGVLLTIRRRRDIEGLSVAERVYEDLVSAVRYLLRIEPLAHQTPHEYAGIVAQQVPKGREAVEQIAGLYVEERFGAKEVPGAHAEVAWRQAWPTLWHRWLERRVERVRRFWWLFIPPKEFPES
jgi:transglutaminase-like putative cysteine protease